jgi:aryl carrier-like protein
MSARTRRPSQFAASPGGRLPTAVGVLDNFFNLGGDSLRAVQIVARLRETFQVELSLDDFFQSPTIRALAQRVSSSRRLSTSGASSNTGPTSRRKRDLREAA